MASYARGVEVLLGADEVDGVLMTGYFGGYSTEESDLTQPELAAARQMADAVAAQGKPVVVQTIYPDGPTAQVLRAAGIPVHRDVDRACAVLAGLVVVGSAGHDAAAPGPCAAGQRHVVRRGAGAVRRGRRLLPGRSVGVGRAAGSRPPSTAVGFPVVLKATGRLHKSEGGGVVLGLAGPGARARGVPTSSSTAWRRLRCRSRRWPTSPRRRGDRRLRARPEVRPGRHGGARWRLHRGARATPPARSRRCQPAAARELLLSLRARRCCSAPAAVRRSTWTRWPSWSPASPTSRRPTPSWSSSSSTRSSPAAQGAGAGRSRGHGVSPDVAQVALVEAVHPGVLGREDPVVEGA